MNRIMLDLETLGTNSSPLILSVGAVRFDIDKGITGAFRMVVDAESASNAGLKIDVATVLWWLRQSDDARSSVSSRMKFDINYVLDIFRIWSTEGGSQEIDEIWGNGATADNVWLANAYKCCKKNVPWSYEADRCFRTMRAMFPDVARPEFVGVEHDALDDARNQALHLIEILKKLPSN